MFKELQMMWNDNDDDDDDDDDERGRNTGRKWKETQSWRNKVGSTP